MNAVKRNQRRFISALLCFSLLAPALGYADTLPADAPVVPVDAGEPAPFDGLLVREERFKLYIKNQMDAESCDERIKARDNAVKDAERRAARGFFEQHGLLIGFVGGVIVTSVVAWKVAEATARK